MEVDFWLFQKHNIRSGKLKIDDETKRLADTCAIRIDQELVNIKLCVI